MLPMKVRHTFPGFCLSFSPMCFLISIQDHIEFLKLPRKHTTVKSIKYRTNAIAVYSNVDQWIYHNWRDNGGACGVMVIVVGNGHGDTSSNPRWDWLHFT